MAIRPCPLIESLLASRRTGSSSDVLAVSCGALPSRTVRKRQAAALSGVGKVIPVRHVLGMQVGSSPQPTIELKPHSVGREVRRLPCVVRVHAPVPSSAELVETLEIVPLLPGRLAPTTHLLDQDLVGQLEVRRQVGLELDKRLAKDRLIGKRLIGNNLLVNQIGRAFMELFADRARKEETCQECNCLHPEVEKRLGRSKLAGSSKGVNQHGWSRTATGVKKHVADMFKSSHHLISHIPQSRCNSSIEECQVDL